MAVRLRGIGKRFPGVVANHDIDIDVRAGTVHAIVGENGAGKSTLMKILYGVQKPDSGTIEVGGNAVEMASPADAIKVGIGMVFQHFMLADNLTVLENVVLGAEKLHGIGDKARTEFERISSTYGFDLDPDQLVEVLGVGARQRVEILKVLYRGAKVIILDEPTAVLVPQEVDALFDNLRELKKEGHTLIFISHKLDEVLAVADDITVVRRGTTVAAVRPADVTARKLAELMVGSELPSPEHRRSPRSLRRRDAACSTTSRLVDAAGRTLLDAVSLRIRRGEVLGVAGVEGNGQAELTEVVMGTRHPTSGSRAPRGDRTSPPGRRGDVASPASGTSPRTGSATGCCSTPRSGRTACSATRPGRRRRRAPGSTGPAHARTASASSRSTTCAPPRSRRPRGRCPAGTSRSSSWGAR